MKPYRRSLFLFTRDLRIEDNTGFIRALHESELVYACMFLRMLDVFAEIKKGNAHARSFISVSAEELSTELKKRDASLSVFSGAIERVLPRILRQQKINAVFVNVGYTPFFNEAARRIKRICHVYGCAFIQTNDTLLYAPGEIQTGSGNAYQVYSAFARKAVRKQVQKPVTSNAKHLYPRLLKGASTALTLRKMHEKEGLFLHGGRKEALRLLKQVSTLKYDDASRNALAIKGTSYLSAHHAFGTISIRETYWAARKKFGASHTFIKELLWRDFFHHVGFFYPHVFTKAFHSEYQKIRWSKKPSAFRAWCLGKTGVPIVDAGMRQLNQTGFMPNRVRMIAASFLIKDLHIDWRKGEKYFAEKLIDYDKAVNNGNWQWVASTGCDAQPYLRIFNPWLQQKRFDADAAYIKQWVSELAKEDRQNIHAWHSVSSREAKRIGYPVPIVHHEKERARALRMYKKG